MRTERFRPHSLLNRGLFLGLLLLLVWVPLPLGSNRAWSLAMLEVWVFLLGALALLGWAVRPGQFSRNLRHEWQVLALLLLGLLYLGLQLLPIPLSLLEFIAPAKARWWQASQAVTAAETVRLAASWSAAIAAALEQCAYVVVFCLTLVLVDTVKRLRMVIYTMIGVTVFEAVYGLTAFFMRDSFMLWTPPWLGHHWATGTFINKNHYAANLSFGIALTLGLCLSFVAAQPYRRWHLRAKRIAEHMSGALLNPGYLRFGLLLALFTAFFFAQSRGALLAFTAAAGSLLACGAYWRGYRERSRPSTAAPSAEIRVLPWLFASAALAAVWLNSSALFTRLLPAELHDSGRVITWLQTWSMWLDHWCFGVGNGSFQYVFTHYKVAALDGHLYDYAHNDHLQLLAEQGVIGAGLFLAFFLLCTGRMLAAYGKRARSHGDQGVLLGIAIAVSAFFLHGFVDFNFHIPANALWFYTLMALGLVAARRIVQGVS
ncbi:MAG: O-antigen ligase family protein [Halioglobus sp.]|nr:O-antigen ligase family protein [Halioglobus sp.]